MWPQPRAGMLPHLLVVAVLLMAADNAGIIDLTGQASPPTPHVRHRPTTNAKTAQAPSRSARVGIPRHYLALYRATGHGETWRSGRVRYAAWAVLAGIGKVESDHGRSSAPGVRSGVNRFGCCAGPMQFNLRDGPPSTWDTWGRGNVYDPADAIPAAARKLRGQGARHHLDQALLAYNRSWAYMRQVKALARSYQH